jgi:hypothetical protein
VTLPGEEHDHRISAELEDVAAVTEDCSDQSSKDRVEDVVDVLSTASPESSQTLGQLGEAGDVEERERSLDLAPPAFRGRLHHPQSQIRHVRVQRPPRNLSRQIQVTHRKDEWKIRTSTASHRTAIVACNAVIVKWFVC